ncbi:MAG: hypothetical protein R3F11_23055 [Verrucomicrobiales bacterium]
MNLFGFVGNGTFNQIDNFGLSLWEPEPSDWSLDEPEQSKPAQPKHDCCENEYEAYDKAWEDIMPELENFLDLRIALDVAQAQLIGARLAFGASVESSEADPRPIQA